MKILAIALFILFGVGLHYARKYISIAAAYKAKILCSGVFISGRTHQTVLREDLEVEDLSYLRFISTDVDLANKQVIASFLGLVKRKAVYSHGQGCTLVYGDQGREAMSRYSIQSSTYATDTLTSIALDSGIPDRNDGFLGQNENCRLDTVLDWAFAEPDPKHKRRTRAVLILRDGKIVAERYAPGFDQDMPLPGWSMAKGVVNALVGILVGQGKLDLDAPAAVPEWQGIDDPRREITLDQLMRMTSGLEFTEKSNNPLYDLTKMLLTTPDSAAYAANQPLQAKPGTHWCYASGTTNIISRIIRSALGEADYRQFPRQALFGPLGMGSAMFECDASGTFVGSSFLYATARDWAKFGQLYCQDGVWEGKRILPQGWVGYSTTPSAPDRQYGAHFWLDIQQKKNSPDMEAPLPADAFHAMGYEGQCVSIMPSNQLVVVRLGLTRKSSAWQQDCFLNLIIDALAGTAEFR